MDDVRQLRGRIYDCQKCKLGKNNAHVPYGGITWAPELILMGEAPGAKEEKSGLPFVGRAGRLLDSMLKKAGGDRRKTMAMNTICCRPPKNRDPEWGEIQACKGNRDDQIQLGQTWVGVILGRVALGALKDDPGIQIGSHKGKPFWLNNMLWVPTYHPAYALRNEDAVSIITSHLKLALDFYWGVTEPPDPPGKKWTMEKLCLILDSDASYAPQKVVDIARATFTRVEWVKLQYESSETIETIIVLKQELGVTVVK